MDCLGVGGYSPQLPPPWASLPMGQGGMQGKSLRVRLGMSDYVKGMVMEANKDVAVYGTMDARQVVAAESRTWTRRPSRLTMSGLSVPTTLSGLGDRRAGCGADKGHVGGRELGQRREYGEAG